MGDDGQGLRKAFGKRHGGNAPGQQNHRHGGGSGGAERDAAQGDAASGVHAALELPERTLDVDAGRIVDAVVDIQYVINLPQQSAVGGRRVVPRFDGRGFRSIQLASQVGCQYFFVDL